MRYYRYRALRASGAVVSGVVRAHEPPEVDRLLAKQTLRPLEVIETAPPRRGLFSANQQEIAVVLRSVASLYESGAPLITALDVAEKLTTVATIATALAHTRQLLIEGEPLADALASSRILPEVAIGILRAGERGGQLQTAMNQAATYLEGEAEAAARLRKALTYPTVLLVAGLLSVLAIWFVVVPRFVELLRDAGQGLPPATRMLVYIGEFVRSHWLAMLAGAGLLAVAANRWTRVPRNLVLIHEGLLKVPVVGKARQASATSRLARSLGAMLESGLPLLKAMEVARESLADYALTERLERAIPRIASGAGVAASLAAEGVLLPSALALIGVGEANGKLGEMLLRAGQRASNESEAAVNAAITLIEPALVLAFGSVVAFVAAAMFQAVYSLRPGM